MTPLASRSARLAAAAGGLKHPAKPRRGAGQGHSAGSRTLPCIIGVALFTLGALVSRDHLVPALRPAEAAATMAPAGVGVAVAGLAETGSPGASAQAPSVAAHGSPLLSGEAARAALRERQREDRLGKLRQPNFDEGLPFAL